jgi:hypothetical protein
MSIGMLTEPATKAVPNNEMIPPTASALRRPRKSLVNPWMMAPNAAPAANKAVTAPIISDVFFAVAMSQMSGHMQSRAVCRTKLTIEGKVCIKPWFSDRSSKD